jgi:ferredoxin
MMITDPEGQEVARVMMCGANKGDGRGRWSLEVKEEECLGWGACVPVCPVGALRLVVCEEEEIPETRRRLMLQILKEKRRLKPYLVSGARSKVRSLLRIKRSSLHGKVVKAI